MTDQEILDYACKGIRAERHLCVVIRNKALSLVGAYGETAQRLVDDSQRDIDALDAKLKELENMSHRK